MNVIALCRELALLRRYGPVHLPKVPRPLRAVAYALVAWEAAGYSPLDPRPLDEASLRRAAQSLPEGDMVRESLLAAASAVEFHAALGRGEDGTPRLAFLEARAVACASAALTLRATDVPDLAVIRPYVLTAIRDHEDREDDLCPAKELDTSVRDVHGLSRDTWDKALRALCASGEVIRVVHRRKVSYRVVE